MSMSKGAKRGAVATFVMAGLLVGLCGTASAGPILMQGQSLTDLLGASPQAIDTTLVTDMTLGNLTADTYSQAYTDGAGNYVYLYQVVNKGTPANAPVEQFTLWPFTGADDSTVLGYLTGATPTDFLSGGQTAKSRAYVRVLSSGPQLSFYYPLLDDLSIDPGEHSIIMYVASRLHPDLIIGNVIDGSVGTGPVVGPVPEPAAASVLLVGSLMILRRRKR